MLLADLGMDVVVIAAPNDPLGMGIPILGAEQALADAQPEGSGGAGDLPQARCIGGCRARRRAARWAKKLGVDYETMRGMNPRIVYCSISGYGQDGPYRDRVGHDVNYLGFAGVIDSTGVREGQPVIPGVQIADIGGGAFPAVSGILTALLAREATGEGQFVDIGMMDGAVSWQVINVFNQLAQGTPQTRGATMLTGEHPCYALYETKDGAGSPSGRSSRTSGGTCVTSSGLEDLIPQQFAGGAARTTRSGACAPSSRKRR
jgi:crotonobetainyl-CoA:carnitine CoA-transferase CaiB-like acyl-CoA transferase